MGHDVLSREALEKLVHEALTEGLPRPWAPDRPLIEAGLDSVAVLTIVAEIEARLGITLRDEDLSAENFATLESLAALIAAHSGAA